MCVKCEMHRLDLTDFTYEIAVTAFSKIISIGIRSKGGKRNRFYLIVLTYVGMIGPNFLRTKILLLC